MKEVKLYSNVVIKLMKKYPAYFENLIHDFSNEYNIETDEEFKQALSQPFYSWLFLDYIMLDGKRIIDFCLISLNLTKEEISMLEKIKKAIRGLYKVKSNSDNILKLQNFLTKEKFDVSIMDFELKKGIIKANLVRNFKDKLFLFGGVQVINKDEVEQYLIEDGLI